MAVTLFPGMSYDAACTALGGPPDASTSPEEMRSMFSNRVSMGGGGGASGRMFCTWRRPEGAYDLEFVHGSLHRVHRAP